MLNGLSGKIYFNEFANYPATWLKNLWPNATVDSRSIKKVDCTLEEYNRVHLFAGIGGWEYALQLAEWPVEESVWTGSCPCQPFSRAGKQKKEEDERHLWPDMFRLIERNRPSTVFGEQVAGKSGLEWFDGVRIDLASIGYTCGMAVLPASCVGSPHKRDRIFWVANSSWPTRNRTFMRSDARTHCRILSKEWGDYYSYECSDGKKRRVGTKVQPLDARLPGDLGRLLAYGNSIVPQVAAVFIRAYMDAKSGVTFPSSIPQEITPLKPMRFRS